MNSSPFHSVAAVGDVSDPATWSGTPWHFWKAGAAEFGDVQPWRPDLASVRWSRRWWNLEQVVRGRRIGGFQYSPEFLDAAEAQIPAELKSGRVVSFNQFFPRARSLARHGGELVLYLDATFPRLLERYGLSAEMDRRTANEARAAERENLAAATCVFAFQDWTARSLVEECGVEPAKVRVVLPGANLPAILPATGQGLSGRAGCDRPLTLGFVGKDWRRKNLPFLVEVARKLNAAGVSTVVRCAGGCPPELQRDPLVNWVGFLDKRRDPEGFVRFLRSCDFGCLFSHAEASSIAVLEFLRAGVPVMGFVVDGMGDLLLPPASLRFAPTESAGAVAERVAATVRDEARLAALRAGAAAAAEHVTWERCVREIAATLQTAARPETGVTRDPSQPWAKRMMA